MLYSSGTLVPLYEFIVVERWLLYYCKDINSNFLSRNVKYFVVIKKFRVSVLITFFPSRASFVKMKQNFNSVAISVERVCLYWGYLIKINSKRGAFVKTISNINAVWSLIFSKNFAHFTSYGYNCFHHYDSSMYAL